MAGGNKAPSAAAGTAAVEAAAIPGPAAAGRQLQCSHAGSHAGPQGRSAYFPPVQGRLCLLLPPCAADHSLCAHPTGAQHDVHMSSAAYTHTHTHTVHLQQVGDTDVQLDSLPAGFCLIVFDMYHAVHMSQGQH